jgi:hypothetical protein
LQHSAAPLFPDILFDLFQASQLDARFPPRFGCAHTGTALLIGQLVQVGVKFVIEIALDAALNEQITGEASQPSEE